MEFSVCVRCLMNTALVFILHALPDSCDGEHRLFRLIQMQKVGTQTPSLQQLLCVEVPQKLRRHLIFDILSNESV